MDQGAILRNLEPFIVRAKSRTYVGSGQNLLPYRLGSQDLQHSEDDWVYHDSYFGNSDFDGQEVVYFQGRPIWVQNYFGYLIHQDKITAAEAGAIIKQSLTAMYQEGRFLGGFTYSSGDLTYEDTSEGDVFRFRGHEWIRKSGEQVYTLLYHGGLIR